MDQTEQRLETAKFADLARRAQRSSRAVFSEFLNPDAQQRLLALARREGLESGLFGGSAEPERAVVGLWQPGCDPEGSPIDVLRIHWDARYASVQHRDVLGACLGLGIERETLGDIRLKDDNAYLAVLPAMGAYLLGALTSVGRASVKVEYYDGELPDAEAGERAVVNVPSLRLDAVLAQTLRLSRAKAQTLIRGGAVRRNWQETDRTDAEVEAGDVLSVRGQGRVRVLRVAGESRKGRLFVEVETLLKP